MKLAYTSFLVLGFIAGCGGGSGSGGSEAATDSNNVVENGTSSQDSMVIMEESATGMSDLEMMSELTPPNELTISTPNGAREWCVNPPIGLLPGQYSGTIDSDIGFSACRAEVLMTIVGLDPDEQSFDGSDRGNAFCSMTGTAQILSFVDLTPDDNFDCEPAIVGPFEVNVLFPELLGVIQFDIGIPDFIQIADLPDPIMVGVSAIDRELSSSDDDAMTIPDPTGWLIDLGFDGSTVVNTDSFQRGTFTRIE